MPGEATRSAVATWGPRFTAQGVDPGDYARVTEGLERWEDWLGAWSANGDLHARLAREAEDRGRSRTAGEAWVRAALSYHFAKFVWMVDIAGLDSTKEEFFALENVFLARAWPRSRWTDPGRARPGTPPRSAPTSRPRWPPCSTSSAPGPTLTGSGSGRSG
jgi:hypothetical protein